jgi:tetratricopeptide (TPR) repeat protein
MNNHRVLSCVLHPLLFALLIIFALSESAPALSLSYYPRPQYPAGYAYMEPITRPSHNLDEQKEICAQDSTNQQAWFELIQLYLYKRDFPNGLNTCIQVSKWCQDTATLYLLRGEFEAAMNHPAEARNWYEKAIKANPENALSYMKLGYALLNDNPEQSMAYLEKATSLPSAKPWMFQVLGQQYKKNNQEDKIIPLINRMNRTVPDSLDTWFVSGFLYQQVNKPGLAAPYFNQIISQDIARTIYTQKTLSLLIYDKPDKELPGFIETLLKQYPGDTTLARQAWYALHAKYTPESVTQLNTLLELQPLFSKYYPDDSFNDQTRYDLVRFMQFPAISRNLNTLLEDRLKKNPRDITLLYLLSSYYRLKNQKEKALIYAQTALNLAPRNRMIMVLNADILESFGRYTESIPLRESLINQDTTPSSRIHNGFQLARALISTGKPAEADSLLERMGKEYGNYNEEWINQMGNFYEMGGKKEKALAVYQLYAVETQASSYVRQNIARLLHDLGRKDESLAEYQKMMADKTESGTKNMAINGIMNYYQEMQKPVELWSFYTSCAYPDRKETTNDSFLWGLPSAYQSMQRTDFLIDKLEARMKEGNLTSKEGIMLANTYSQNNRQDDSLRTYEYLYAHDSSNSEVIFRLMNFYQQKAQWDKVIALGERVVAQDSSLFNSYATALGKAYKETGNREKLDRLMKVLTEKAAKNPETNRILADMYQIIGRIDLAISTYEKIPAPEDDYYSNQGNFAYQKAIYLGQLYSQSSQYKKAIQLYEDYLNKRLTLPYQANATIYDKLIDCCLDTGDLKKISFWVEKMLKNNSYDFGLQYYPVYYSFQRHISQEKDFQKVWKIIEAYYQGIRKGKPSISDWEAADEATQQGNILPWENRQKGLPALEKMAKDKPKDPLVYICLKAIYQQDWNTYRQKGLELWQTAVTSFPKEPQPYEYLGEIALNALNNKEIGIPAYEKALGIYEAKKNYSKTASLLTILIIQYHNNKQDDKSKQSFQRYQDYLDKKVSFFSPEQLGYCYEQIQDYAKALEVYQNHLNTMNISRGNNYQYYQLKTAISRCYLRLKQYDKAEENLRPLLSDTEYLKQNSWVLEDLARAYDGQGLYEIELENMLLLVKVNPKRFEYNSLSQALLNFGDPNNKERITKLAEACEKKLKADPENWILQGIRADLWMRMGKTPPVQK